MNLLLCLKRPFIWLSRFRYRCGYGVHSPFAFSLITDVIYEKMPYYAYDSLEKEQKKIVEERGCNKGTQKGDFTGQQPPDHCRTETMAERTI